MSKVLDASAWYRDGFHAMGMDAAGAEALGRCCAGMLEPERNRDISRWEGVLDELAALLDQGLLSVAGPRLEKIPVAGDAGALAVGLGDHDWNDAAHIKMTELLQSLMPWRKGPFVLGGITVDTEWRSDLKWDRLAAHISPLRGRRVLDVGCGSGYHLWRMVLDGSCAAIGLEPYLLSVYQYRFCAALGWPVPARVVPCTLEDWHGMMNTQHLFTFDTVFSMGVLYHRKDHIAHLSMLGDLMEGDGELVLESLVLPGSGQDILVPPGRYAGMANVHALPTLALLEGWCKTAGFSRLRVLDVSPTTTREQRQTPMMTFHSLAQALDDSDPSLTVEGHPAPLRAILLAKK